jgi:hypothetical protein
VSIFRRLLSSFWMIVVGRGFLGLSGVMTIPYRKLREISNSKK